MQIYFERFKTCPPFFDKKIAKNTEMIVVIPCYDDDDVFLTLNSLQEAQRPKCTVEVIVVVNSAENTPENIVQKNRSVFEKLQQFYSEKKYFFELSPILIENVPKKFAGVGNARKVGSDEAVRHFLQIGKSNGLIAGLDCDCLVAENYFTEIEKAHKQNPDIQLFTFNFQHNFDEKRFSKQEIFACKLYEIYLRYYRIALQETGFSHCFHTIGSCFAVTALAYTKVGGMPRLQAGEDFYFLHKAAQYTKNNVIMQKIVSPAPRISERVPFGTGKAVIKIISGEKYTVYNYGLFAVLKRFFDCFTKIYDTKKVDFPLIPAEITNYFSEEKLLKIFNEVISNSKHKEQYIKRLYTKFDAFFVVQFLNSFNNSAIFPPMEINVAVENLLKTYNISAGKTLDENFRIIENLNDKLLNELYQ
ncbi:MAG: hypothetical protein LBS50_03045 [Prevotellaceae bacterium]|jgi:hypothetical protein|nr:hypothetical protein [Prevotellaceae bacterium]